MGAFLSLTSPGSPVNAAPPTLQEILGSLSDGCTLCGRGKSFKEWRAVMKTVDIVIGPSESPLLPCGRSAR